MSPCVLCIYIWLLYLQRLTTAAQQAVLCLHQPAHMRVTRQPCTLLPICLPTYTAACTKSCAAKTPDLPNGHVCVCCASLGMSVCVVLYLLLRQVGYYQRNQQESELSLTGKQLEIAVCADH